MKKEKSIKRKSIKTKLLLSYSMTIVVIILFIILINSIVLEPFYIKSKTKTITNIYKKINDYYNNNNDVNIEQELKINSIKNNFDILIQANQDIVVFSEGRDIILTVEEMMDMSKANVKEQNKIKEENNLLIQKVKSDRNNENFILLTAKLDNDYILYIRIAISPIQESVRISNKLLIFVGAVAICISCMIATIIAKKFADPISELEEIAEKMALLDFSQKYKEKEQDDEINILGKSINKMSDTLKMSIEELKKTNIELEKDIEEKSKIDEMRKQFISDVSHELKTPIALIQGYAEGLLENVNSDEESRDFYAEVILDETNKMDKIVKQLLELMKLEYGRNEIKKEYFNIVELIEETVKRYNVVLKENNIQVNFDKMKEIIVYAGQFSIEQIFTNYFTNAVKNVQEKDGGKVIEIRLETISDKIRLTVFNSGENIEVEEMDRIWKRFYKIDEARSRENGGTGIGLSIVKALMNNYKNDYGVINVKNGVEFYFDIDIEKSDIEKE